MAAPVRTTQFHSSVVRRIAVEAAADPRTVVRFVTGKPVAGVSAERIAAALKRLGLSEPDEKKAA